MASNSTTKSRSETALVVDMDGSLLRTDTLFEMVVAHFSTKPWILWKLPSWLRFGRAGFKKRIADLGTLAADTLPVNQPVLEYVGQAKAEGRHVALVSAADQRQVTRVAEHLGLFNEWHGTENSNLSGATKAAFLVERYGEQGFDYIGDSSTDMPVWQAARRAITVGASKKLQKMAKACNPEVEHLHTKPRSVMSYVKALRPYQWVKNILIFVPILAAHQPGALLSALLAFVAFCLAASSVYLINDLLDLEADRSHPRKCKRPLAAADIPIWHGVLMALFLVLIAFAISAMLSGLFLLVISSYLALTFGYSLFFKRKLVIDIWVLAGLYTSRILAGAAATAIKPSPWLLTFSIFIFFALAAVKRQAEMVDKKEQGENKAVGRAYTTSDLPVIQSMALSSGYAAVVVFALYINSSAVEALYSFHEILWIVPVALLFWITHLVMATHRGRMDDDPIIFAVRDRLSQITGLAILSTIWIASQVWA